MGQLNLQKLDTRIDKLKTELDELRALARTSEKYFKEVQRSSRADVKFVERSRQARRDWEATEAKADRLAQVVSALLAVRSQLVESQEIQRDAAKHFDGDLPTEDVARAQLRRLALERGIADDLVGRLDLEYSAVRNAEDPMGPPLRHSHSVKPERGSLARRRKRLRHALEQAVLASTDTKLRYDQTLKGLCFLVEHRQFEREQAEAQRDLDAVLKRVNADRRMWGLLK